jgi:hypothetical protein
MTSTRRARGIHNSNLGRDGAMLSLEGSRSLARQNLSCQASAFKCLTRQMALFFRMTKLPRMADRQNTKIGKSHSCDARTCACRDRFVAVRPARFRQLQGKRGPPC